VKRTEHPEGLIRRSESTLETSDTKVGTKKSLNDIDEAIALLRFKRLMLEDAGKLRFDGYVD